jgi:hypothetical protein
MDLGARTKIYGPMPDPSTAVGRSIKKSFSDFHYCALGFLACQTLILSLNLAQTFDHHDGCAGLPR